MFELGIAEVQRSKGGRRLTDEQPSADGDAPGRFRIGLDIGGTFTDLALHDRRTGDLHIWKQLSTFPDPSDGALAGMDALLEITGVRMDQIEHVVHGTTIGANIVIEGRGAATALLVTEGFRDVLLLQRPVRYSTYDLWFDKHAPLVPRAWVFPLRQRIGPAGRVERDLDQEDVRNIVGQLRAEGIESVAVSLLHSYANGLHERQIEEIIRRELPEVSVSVSHAVAPIIGEYERASTTVVNAYVRPAFRRYLARLERALLERGFSGQMYINQGNGGLTVPDEVAEFPIRAIESGPAAGVSMAAWVGTSCGRKDMIAFDMGGTTAKACLIEDGQPRMDRVFEIDQTLMRRGTGLPLVTPSVDLIEIGAGGGSIASIGLGVIRVGPESAGAEPGPVAYGRGGTRVTVTDANVVLGYLNPTNFLGGKMRLNAEQAKDAIEEQIARPLALDVPEAAWGIHEAVTSNMEHAIRSVSVERGRDPRDLTLIAFGGAGPTHAMRLARNLGIREVVCPAAAGIGSAVGLLQAAPRVDLSHSFVSELKPDRMRELQDEIQHLEGAARRILGRIEPQSEPRFQYLVDMQYAGQGHVIGVEFVPDETRGLAKTLYERFEASYAEAYGYSYESGTPQVRAVTVVGSVATGAFELPKNEAPGGRLEGDERSVFFPEHRGYAVCPVFDRNRIPTGAEVIGPAVIEDDQCSILLLPGDVAEVDGHRNILARVAQAPDGGLTNALVSTSAGPGHEDPK